MNILLLSVGTRNKIVQYFKKSIGESGKIIVTDMCDIASAIYEADKFYQVPPITDAGYIDLLLDICRKEKIDAVLSLIDPELSLLAKNKDVFMEQGVTVIGSSYELCEMSLDKYQMYNWLIEHGYKCAQTFMSFEEFDKSGIGYPVVIKPVRGSASIGISRADDEKSARFFFEKSDGMMIQNYMKGQEVGADVYIDMISGEVVSIFAKKKIVMRAGETDKAVSFKDEKLFRLIERFAKEAGFCGQIDIDIFDIDGEYYISEVNPRFGGGYPHAYESGVDHMKLIINNINGVANEKNIGDYQEGIYMMKYSEVRILKDKQ